MHLELAKKLIELRSINPTSTEIEIIWDKKKEEFQPGPFTIKSVLATPDRSKILFEGQDERGRRRRIPVEQVIMIDGMDPSRFAAIHGLKADGTELPKQKRRGRKPKHLKEENIEM